jgi:hypothetical protein
MILALHADPAVRRHPLMMLPLLADPAVQLDPLLMSKEHTHP